MNTKDFSNDNNIPSLPKGFPLENLKYIFNSRKNVLRLSREIGPIFKIYNSGTRYIFVGSLEASKELSDQSKYDKSVLGFNKSAREIAKDGLFTVETDDANWKRAHEILLPAFTQEAITKYFSYMYEILENMLAKWHNIPQGQEFNLMDDLFRLTTDTINLCAFSGRTNSFSSSKINHFYQTFEEVLQQSALISFLPEWMKKFLTFSLLKRKKKIAFIHETIDKIINDRIDHPEKYANAKDLLSLMLNSKDRTCQSLDRLNIRNQIITFFIAGSDTTKILLSAAIYYLVNAPDILAKVHEEIDRIYGPDINIKPSLQDLSKLKYLSQIIDESLRLHPPLPILHLAPKHDTLFLGKYPVTKKDVIVLYLQVLHRETAAWGNDPDRFDPNHFLPEAIANRDPAAFKPFGAGIRACIGQQFALQEAKLALSVMLHRYRFKLAKETQAFYHHTPSIKPENVFVSIEKRTYEERLSHIT